MERPGHLQEEPRIIHLAAALRNALTRPHDLRPPAPCPLSVPPARTLVLDVQDVGPLFRSFFSEIRSLPSLIISWLGLHSNVGAESF